MRLLLSPLLVLLLGCQGGGDEFARPGTWQASGANAANLRAMLAEPRDLIQGRGSATSRGQAGAVAIERLETGRRSRLPASNLSRVGGGGADVAPDPVGGQANAR